MTRLGPFALVLGLVACGGGSHAPKQSTPTPDPVPKTAGPPCGDVAAHIVQVAGAGDPSQDMSKIGETVRVRCAADHWSDEARSCFSTMQSEPEADGCAKLLTPEQRGAMERATQNTNVQDAPPVPPAAGATMGSPAPVGAAAPGAPADGAPAASHTRGATKKAKPKTGNPCDGGQ